MLEKWLARDRNPIDTAVQPRRRLAIDDAATDPHQVSHAVLSALSHAIDHLSCFRTLVVDAGALHIYAPFTLLRAATENIATALWLLQPPERQDRVQRRLWLANANLRRRDPDRPRRTCRRACTRTEGDRLSAVAEILDGRLTLAADLPAGGSGL